jgi:hypothetical protein
MTQTATPRKPAYEDLFREPVYVDGPYDQGDEDDVLEDPANITA